MSWSDPPSTRLFRYGDLDFAFDLPRAISYLSHHCHIPIISGIEITNRGDSSTEPFVLTIEIPGYTLPLRLPVENLGPHTATRLTPIPLELCYERLQGLEARRYAALNIAVAGHAVFHDEALVLGFYEWPLTPEARKTLACYVQPGHAIIQQILADANEITRGEGNDPTTVDGAADIDDGEAALYRLHETLRLRYNLRYVAEAPSYETEGQAIRPPHKVIPNPRTRAGAGTCIDLSLLYASCLEGLHLQPLVIVVRDGDHRNQHAIVGCWKTASERLEPVIESESRITEAVRRGRLIPLEATGVTLKAGRTLPFHEAVGAARQRLAEGTMAFALDIAAARDTVVPLEFPLSPGTLSILGASQRIARRARRGTLESEHLFVALLREAGPRVASFLSSQAFSDPDPYGPAIIDTPEDTRPPRATLNYRRCIDDARAIAGDCGAGFVEEEHLLYALLLSPSRSIDRELERRGVSRHSLLGAFERQFLWTRDLVSTEHGRSSARDRSPPRGGRRMRQGEHHG